MFRHQLKIYSDMFLTVKCYPMVSTYVVADTGYSLDASFGEHDKRGYPYPSVEISMNIATTFPLEDNYNINPCFNTLL